MSSDPIADKHRRLADALEAARAEGVEVDGVESYTVDGELVATVDVGIGEETVRPDQSTTDDVVDADASAVDPTNEPAPSVPAESDTAPGDLENEENTQNSDEEFVESVHEVAEDVDLDDDSQEDEPEPDAKGDTDQDENESPVEEGTLESKVLAALREEGELTASELEEITSAGNVHHPLSVLAEDDLVEKRQDPDDGRRKLYRPAGWLVDDQDDEEDVDDGPEWNGRDPEEIVADSSLPATIVLEDILDAVATADTVIDVAEQMDVDVDNLGPVCWHLTLKQPDSLSIVDDVDERAALIREVVEA